MSALAVRAERYLEYNLSHLEGETLKEFIDFIRNHGQANDQSFSKKFIDAMTENNMKFLNRAQAGFNISFLVGIVFIIFFLMLSILFLIMLLEEILRVISLLFKFP